MVPAFSRAIVPALALITPSVLLGQAGTAEVNGVSVPYEIEGEGPPLVLIHGWAVHRGFWDDDVKRLARRHLVIRYDRRGFGDAGGKPDLTADPADLKALLDRLGVTRAHIMGHSQGTTVALSFALRYPEMVDALVLFGPNVVAGQDLPPSDDLPAIAAWVALGNAHGVDSLRAAIGQWAMGHFGGSMEGIAAKAQPLMAAYSGADLLDPAPPSDLVQLAGVSDLAAVKAPTLVIHGDQEMAFIRAAADVLAAGIPGAKRVIIPGGGHVVNWQQPDRFAAAVLEFLRSAHMGSQ